jgi:hypothetical protein
LLNGIVNDEDISLVYKTFLVTWTYVAGTHVEGIVKALQYIIRVTNTKIISIFLKTFMIFIWESINIYMYEISKNREVLNYILYLWCYKDENTLDLIVCWDEFSNKKLLLLKMLFIIYFIILIFWCFWSRNFL